MSAGIGAELLRGRDRRRLARFRAHAGRRLHARGRARRAARRDQCRRRAAGLRDRQHRHRPSVDFSATRSPTLPPKRQASQSPACRLSPSRSYRRSKARSRGSLPEMERRSSCKVATGRSMTRSSRRCRARSRCATRISPGPCCRLRTGYWSIGQRSRLALVAQNGPHGSSGWPTDRWPAASKHGSTEPITRRRLPRSLSLRVGRGAMHIVLGILANKDAAAIIRQLAPMRFR